MEPRQYRDRNGQLGVGFEQPTAGMVSIAWQQTPPSRYLIGDLDGYGITDAGPLASVVAPATSDGALVRTTYLEQEVTSLKHEIELLTQTNYNLRERIDVLTLPQVPPVEYEVSYGDKLLGTTTSIPGVLHEPDTEPLVVAPDTVANTEAGQIDDTEPTSGHVEGETVVAEPEIPVDDIETVTDEPPTVDTPEADAVDTDDIEEPSEDDLIAAYLTEHGLDVTNKSVIEFLRADDVIVQSTQVTRVKERLRAVSAE